jgi:hypothetical protein
MTHIETEGAGKGDTYRSINKEKWDINYTRIFGEKDLMDFHKDKQEESNQ